jgi:hypothetical protein
MKNKNPSATQDAADIFANQFGRAKAHFSDAATLAILVQIAKASTGLDREWMGSLANLTPSPISRLFATLLQIAKAITGFDREWVGSSATLIPSPAHPSFACVRPIRMKCRGRAEGERDVIDRGRQFQMGQYPGFKIGDD